MGNFFISTAFMLLKFARSVKRATSFSSSTTLRSSSSIVMLYILLRKKLSRQTSQLFSN